MTDKKEFNQKDLNVAFEQLNETEGLQPTAELDAMILKMASDEFQGDSVAEEKSNVTDISDVSFRRGQRDSHKALKKKGMFPNWVMPIGLAATVLLSFGVVNRVLLSPEFDSLTKQSSYEDMSDETIVTTASSLKERAKKDDASLKQRDSAQKKRLQAENADAKIIINGNEMTADISFADKPSRVLADSPPSPPALDIADAQSMAPVEGVRYNDEEMGRVESSTAELETDMQSESDQLLMDSRQEQHALMAKEKRERLTQARRSDVAAMQVEAVSSPVAVSAPQVANAGASLGNIDSVEKVVVAGNRVKNDNDTSGYAMIVGDDHEDMPTESAEAKSSVLQSILFEHKQCQVKQDCALVALECDSCDCLGALNQESYSQYTSEFTQTEIAEQCTETTAECIRNYCQAQQAE